MTNKSEVAKITLKVLAGLTREGDMKAAMYKLAEQKGDFVAIAGDVHAYGVKQGALGDSVMFVGQFVGVNRNTGEVYEATKLYLPRGLADEIKSKFDARTDGNPITFNAEIKPVLAKDAVMGFQYIYKPISTAESLNRSNQLLGQIQALPAPAPLKAIAGSKK